ncbi:MAG TPA: alpha/beta fold hydrolase [Kofleriaceae bacterium]|nr:alpha/beta fold hydrolase [Kofleriaceae bacterium]
MLRRAALVAVAAFGCTQAQLPTPPARPVVKPAAASRAVDHANEAIDALVGGDYAGVVNAFAPDSNPPTLSQVESAWRTQAAGLGEYRSWSQVDRTFQDGFEVRILHIELERGTVQCLVSVDPGSLELRSLFITRPAQLPSYIDRAQIRDVAVTFGTPALDATLTLPSGKGPFPAVVLVHGSGPNDRNNAVGATKIFKDLAEGLASSGIAVLRYDKRTYTYREQLDNSITLDDEVVLDAVAAVKLLAARTDVDASRVFVIGHSLGGLLAPEIAVRAGDVAGIALLAPPGRVPWDIVRDQMRYLGAPRDTLIDTEKAVIELNVGVETGRLAGMPYSYWRDWASRDGVAMVKRFARPTLILHGTRDYQVTDEDFAVWQRGLRDESHVELVTVTGANHLFIAGQGQPTPLEYKVEAHVDARVIAKLVAFVTR